MALLDGVRTRPFSQAKAELSELMSQVGKLQERRTFPAINIPASGTRREEVLLSPEVMRQVILLRKMLSAVGQADAEPARLRPARDD